MTDLVIVPEAYLVKVTTDEGYERWNIVFHPDTPDGRRDRALDLVWLGVKPSDLVNQPKDRAKRLLDLINQELNPSDEAPTPSYPK